MHDTAVKKDSPYFLGVRRSALDKIWLGRLDRSGLNNALAMTQKYGFSDLLSRVLSARGVDEAGAEGFINPTLRDLMPDPACFTDMKQAATRIAAACLRQEQVAIFGDYDVDGACASAILARFLKAVHVRSRIYIPDRLAEGYGPNAAAMHRLAAEGASLIITVDCGANSAETLAAVRASGADVIVLDHHPVLSQNSSGEADWSHVNPNRPDDLSGQGHLCAAGVVFMTLAAVSRILREKGRSNLPDLLGYLDLVALATVCDVVPLKGVNRAFVIKGLQVARTLRNPGLAALAEVARIGEPLNVFHLGYVLGPRINAGGRIGDPALGACLLSCDHQGEAMEMAAQLDKLNRERQEIESAHLEQADMQIACKLAENSLPSGILVADRHWHPGVVGLIAARLKERFARPALAIAIRGDGTGTGSARSVPGIDIGAIIIRAVAEGLLEKGGGHAMAAGLTVDVQKIGQLQQWFEKNISKASAAQPPQQVLPIDGVLSANGVTAQLITMLEKAGPYGCGHDAPVFALPSHRLLDIRQVGKGHISVSLADQQGKRLKGIAFRAMDTALGDFLFASRMSFVHLAGKLALNYWNGQVTPQIHILDAACMN